MGNAVVSQNILSEYIHIMDNGQGQQLGQSEDTHEYGTEYRIHTLGHREHIRHMGNNTGDHMMEMGN